MKKTHTNSKIVVGLLVYGSYLVNTKEFCNHSYKEKKGPHFRVIRFCLQSRSSESLFLPTCNTEKLAKRLIVLPILCNRLLEASTHGMIQNLVIQWFD